MSLDRSSYLHADAHISSDLASSPTEQPSVANSNQPNPANTFDNPTQCLPEIVLGGAVYAVIVFLAGAIFVVYSELGNPVTKQGLLNTIEAVGQSLIVLSGLCILAMATCMFVGMFTLGFISFANWTLGEPLSPISAASCAGGLTGYLPLAVLYLSVEGRTFEDSQSVLLFLAGPCLALIVIQTCARLSCKTEIKKPHNLFTFSHLQFNISTVFAATFWCAILLTVERLVRPSNFLWLIASYIVLQVIALTLATAWAARTRKATHE